MSEYTPTFTVFDTRSEIIGRVFLSAVECINNAETAPALKQLGLTDVQADQWYPMQLWLDFLKVISEQPNTMFNFVSLGIETIQNLDFPPVFDTMPLQDVLQSVPQGYEMDHRGGDYGSVKAELFGSNQLRYVLRTPYPDDYFYGVTYGLVRRFAPPNTNFTVEYDNSVVRRDQGGDKTVINVTWE